MDRPDARDRLGGERRQLPLGGTPRPGRLTGQPAVPLGGEEDQRGRGQGDEAQPPVQRGDHRGQAGEGHHTGQQGGEHVDQAVFDPVGVRRHPAGELADAAAVMEGHGQPQQAAEDIGPDTGRDPLPGAVHHPVAEVVQRPGQQGEHERGHRGQDQETGAGHAGAADDRTLQPVQPAVPEDAVDDQRDRPRDRQVGQQLTDPAQHPQQQQAPVRTAVGPEPPQRRQQARVGAGDHAQPRATSRARALDQPGWMPRAAIARSMLVHQRPVGPGLKHRCKQGPEVSSGPAGLQAAVAGVLAAQPGQAAQQHGVYRRGRMTGLRCARPRLP